MKRASASEVILEGEETRSFLFRMPSTSRTEAFTLLENNPAKSGFLFKKNNSYMAYLFPCFSKKWKNRFCVLIGNYLYKFENEDSVKPKVLHLFLIYFNTSIYFILRSNC